MPTIRGPQPRSRWPAEVPLLSPCGGPYGGRICGPSRRRTGSGLRGASNTIRSLRVMDPRYAARGGQEEGRVIAHRAPGWYHPRLEATPPGRLPEGMPRVLMAAIRQAPGRGRRLPAQRSSAWRIQLRRSRTILHRPSNGDGWTARKTGKGNRRLDLRDFSYTTGQPYPNTD